MRCPTCSGLTRVTSTYQNEDGRVRRRRECLICKKRFTTREAVQLELFDNTEKIEPTESAK